ncbi:MAG: DUF4262 domain-containing protein [Actinomycetota bacterium]
MDAQTLAWMDQQDAYIATAIRRHGVFIAYIGGGECSRPGCDGDTDLSEAPFAYTVGLHGLHHPELLVFDLCQNDSANVLNGMASRIMSGEDFLPGEMIGFEEWSHRAILEIVPNPGEIVFEANRYYGRPSELSVPVIQVSYDDEEGRFPSEDDFLHPGRQPRPGTFQA